MGEYCVYIHTAPNGKNYIGITCCKPRNRRWQNGYGYRAQQHFWNAINKYGWKNFEHRILADNLSKEEASIKEKEYISLYESNNPLKGYNDTTGGEAGTHLSEEHKAKIGKANKGINNGMYGHIYTEEERKAQAIRSTGRRHSKEAKEKMRRHALENNSMRGKCGSSHHNARAVVQIDINGVTIKVFGSAIEASKETGATRAGICNCAKGKVNTAGGYIWKYVN